LKNITGPPVEGENFFGREAEYNYIWNRIRDGNNIIFPSPRRVGKTSFALKLLDKAKNEGWHTLSIDLEKISTEQDFIEIFIGEIKKQSWWAAVKKRRMPLLIFLRRLNQALVMRVQKWN
jgi:AAA+ ATPase superfamily predicted ATPase